MNDENLEDKKYSDVMAEILSKEDKDLALNRLSKIKDLKPDKYDEITYRLYDKDGKVNWIFSRAFGFEYEHDEMKKVIISSLNITKQKEIHAKLEEKKKEVKRQNKELNKINKELKSFQKDLKNKVADRTRELEESEKKCKDFFERSFEGILRYALKDIDGIDTSLPVEEQAKLIGKHAYIAEANKRMAEIHHFDSPDELVGTSLSEFLAMDEKEKAQLIKVYIDNDYKFENQETIHHGKDGKTIKILTNMIGIIKDDKLVGSWGTQKLQNE